MPDQNITITPQASLAQYTTFQLGGPCKELIECQTPESLIQTIRALQQENKEFLLIGGGSNLVVSDHGLDLVVIRYFSPTAKITRDKNRLTVSASTILDDLALITVEEGLDGLIYTSGIPGTVGGAIVGNAGAWGKQVGDVLLSARILDKNGNEKTVDASYFKFSYRNSVLKDTGEIVLEVTFNLKDGDPITLAQERIDILRKRQEKHPNLNTHPCAGSFFRNIEATSKAEKRQAAGYFLEEAGAKDLRVGGAQIFDKHANIIVKGLGCRAQDVYDLHLKMIHAVKNKFNFELQREVRFVGKFKNAVGKDSLSFW